MTLTKVLILFIVVIAIGILAYKDGKLHNKK